MNFIHKLDGGDKKDEPKKEDAKEGEDAGKGEEKKDKKKKKKGDGEIAIQMASGDYLIHVYIEEAKQLDIDEGKHSEVLVGVNVTGFDKPVTFSTSKTNVHKDSVLDWNEHIFIQSGKQEKDKIQDCRIEIKVQEKSELSSSKLIGMYEFSLENTYQKDDHAMLHQWVALIDNSHNTKSISDITGYLKLSVQITGPKDAALDIGEDNTQVDPSEETHVLMPIQVKQKFLQMSLRIFVAQQLPEMSNDALIAFSKNKMDGFVKAKVAGHIQKTKVITMGDDKKIQWNQQIEIAVILPLIDEYIKLEIWDQNNELGATDAIIGSIPIKLSNVLQGIYDVPFWQNIYGAPVNNNKDSTKQMNQNPELASKWKGRVLIQIDKKESRQQRFQVKDIPAAIMQSPNVVNWMNKQIDYEIILDFGMGISLPKPHKFKMGFQMTSKQWVSEPAKNKENSVKGGFNMFSERQTLQFKLPYDKIEQIGKCFLYLIYDGKTISYKRFKATDFITPKPEWSYYELTPDPSIGELSDRQSGGIVSFRAYLRKCGDEPPQMGSMIQMQADQPPRQSEKIGSMQSSISLSQSTISGADRSQSVIGGDKIENYMIEKQLPRRAKSQKVRAYIYQCKDLPAADDDGLSDPFIQIWDQYKECKKTPVVNNSLNPIYYIVREFYYDVFLSAKDQNSPQKIVEGFPPIIIDIWDQDKQLIGSDKSDFMCRSTIFVKDASCRYIDDQENILHQTDYAREKQANDEKAREMKVYSQKQLNLPDTDPASKNYSGLRPPVPKWHECRLYPGAPVSGMVLVSFDICEADTEFNVKAHDFILGKFISMNQILFEIQVLGLRNLQSVGILPVKKATMNFGFANLLPATSEITVKSIKTDPGPAGSNPTINTLISHKMPLPEDQLLCPALTVTVNDNIFNGRVQPMIGNFVIPLGDILFEGNESTQTEISKLADLVANINSVVEETAIPDYARSSQRSVVEGEEGKQGSQHGSQRGSQRPTSINGSQHSVKKSEAEFSEEPDMFAHLGAGKGNARTTSRATARKRNLAEKKKAQVDDERDDAIIDPNFQADKHMQLIEQDLVDRTQTEMLHNKIKNRFVPTLAVLCETLDDTYYPESFDALQQKLISEYAYVMEMHYQVSKKDNEENEGPDKCEGHEGRLDAVSIAALNKKVAEDPRVSVVCKIMEEHVNKNRKNNLEHASRQIDALRARAQGDYERKDPLNAARIVVEPYFEMNDRLSIHVEVDEPPQEIFMALGYNKDHEDGNKQYRKYFFNELESNKEIMPSKPFDTYNIKRGAVRGNKKGLFSVFKKKKPKTADGEIDSSKSMGLFKGIVHVYTQQQKDKQINEKKQHIEEIFDAIQKLRNKLDKTEEEKAQVLNLDMIASTEGRVKFRNKMLSMGIGHLNILKRLMNVEAENFLKRQLSIKQGVYVNAYILTGRNLASRDIGSESDPYIKIKLGNKKQDTRKQYFDDEPNPDFYQKFTFDASFPGAPALKVAAFDYDDLFGDDLIGDTLIDLEDRFYSHHWQSWPQKPIETRQLYHPSSTRSQGELTCFLDVLPESARATQKDVFIEPEPEQELEVRLCVFNTTDIKMMDIEGTSDVYFECYIDNKKKKLKTDVHYRCMDGNADFQYRLKLYYKNTKKSERQLEVRCFDRDLIGKNEFIGSRTIDLWEPIQDCLLTKRQGSVNKKYYNNHLKQFDSWKDLEVKWEDRESFWVDLYDTEKGKQVCNGKVRLRIDLLTKEEADEAPLGAGRKELNQDPHLPPPEGRIEFSMNPWKMLKQLISPTALKKCQKFFCCIICLAITAYTLPGLLENIFGNMISNIF